MAEDMMPAPGSIEAKDPLAAAPPGYGLISDNERWPWGQPPREVNPEAALRAAIDSLEVKQTREEMLKLLMVGASVEALVEGYLFQAFQDGQFMPDVGLLIKGPLAMYIANMAEENDVPYRMFENEDALTEDEMDDQTFFNMMAQNNPAMFTYVAEALNKGIRQGNAPVPPTEENFINMQGQMEE
tara:strand:- start:9152 stop:9706 length:555 start_codon:yes stop_codon:yes gene_type:complete